MSLPVRKAPQALADLAAAADYLAREASAHTAERFLSAAESSIVDLARMPGIGALWESPLTSVQGVRTWPIKKFRKWIVFYREFDGNLEILRVLHGARNLYAEDITTID